MTELEQLAKMTVTVADTGEIEAIKKYKPTDATTNPSLILKAVKMEKYSNLLPEAIKYAKSVSNNKDEQAQIAMDSLAVEFGCKILEIVEGVVSTELDARLSFDVQTSVDRAVRIIEMYEKKGVKNARDRVLIKVASTWEGFQICKILKEKHNINCNMTLLFSIWQAAAAAEHSAFLISPFVGRITDWYKAHDKVDSYEPDNDPGVKSVRNIYGYYKKHGYKTIVMGASFRNKQQILALAGCDRLTIGPQFLEELQNCKDKVEQKLSQDKPDTEYTEKLNLTESNYRYGMSRDPMATDKLAEGIRKFADDIVTLEEMIKKQL